MVGRIRLGSPWFLTISKCKMPLNWRKHVRRWPFADLWNSQSDLAAPATSPSPALLSSFVTMFQSVTCKIKIRWDYWYGRYHGLWWGSRGDIRQIVCSHFLLFITLFYITMSHRYQPRARDLLTQIKLPQEYQWNKFVPLPEVKSGFKRLKTFI